MSENIKIVFYAMFLLILTWGSNFAFSMYYNIKIVKQNFSKEKFYSGILKLICLCLGLGLLCSVMTLFPEYIQNVGIELSEDVVSMFNIAVVVLLFGEAIIRYYKQALGTLKDILDNGTAAE